ncbi:hypothetical protein NOCARDAX2BIS_80040 [Nocardioides sp. AX2bis]|nr:hypothetical protein NOCARDAX2BIS_80040 [Nocardioides sp. AX2bis]
MKLDRSIEFFCNDDGGLYDPQNILTWHQS